MRAFADVEAEGRVTVQCRWALVLNSLMSQSGSVLWCGLILGGVPCENRTEEKSKAGLKVPPAEMETSVDKLDSNMAEIEEIIEGVEEAIEEAEEGLDELPEEVQEELQGEIAEAQEGVSALSEAQKALKALIGTASKLFTVAIKFTLTNVAVGAILWGVNVALSKLLPQGDKQKQEVKRRQQAVIKALIAVIKTETDISQKTVNWLKEHKDDTVTLGGESVPLEALLEKYLTPINDATSQSMEAATALQTDLQATTPYSGLPIGDTVKLISAVGATLNGYSDLITFITQRQQKFPQFESFPVKQLDIVTLTVQIQAVKDLPLW
ncbi:hypothetical protein AOLI_G00300220 [Acnodon oligacanthus]